MKNLVFSWEWKIAEGRTGGREVKVTGKIGG